MHRRKFIRNSSLASLSLGTLWLSACENSPTGNTKQITQKPGSDAAFELEELTIVELQQRMKDGQYTSEAITKLYLDRIEAIDKNGTSLRSVIEVNPDALSIAKAMDEERKNGKLRGPLHGIPILIKDNIDSADKMETTAGSIALAGNRASKDAFIVSKLREAGAVLLGKTNLSEFANFRSSRSSSGWSSRGGQTKNPYQLERNPCGSSSGSGTAASANLCAAAIGTETDGSIICPSSINGLVGIKPTVGLWSRSGIIPISQTQDTAGPMTRTVADAAIVLGALAGIDASDAVTLESNGKIKPDYTQFLDANGLQGKRIGIVKEFMKGHEGVDELLKKSMELLKSKGAILVEVEVIEKFNKLGDAEFTLLKYEFKDGLNKYLASSNAKVKSLKEIIEFNKENEAKAMPFFKQEILESSEKLGGLDSKEYKEALSTSRDTSRKLLQSIMKEHSLDAICGPSYGPSWCTDLVNGDHFSGYGLSAPAAMAGYPHITVPMGMVHGLPIGLSFFSIAYQEASLITLAYAYEQASKHRVAPRFESGKQAV
ncbi:amidase [Rhodocytophaga rosea]|uniref:Amidase n=1 Tax=Rhodocytophaga rosea TaxID=2704465 RepID=A0A6C0GSK0_9BACT|nr:amidase [Rhodocytophaga rosea]QHT70976.1 amidase [Rhodocytophaga rosea]